MSNIISFEGSSSLAPIISSIGNKFMGEAGEKISISVSASGSGAGLKSVLDNKANFGMLSRKIKDSEKSKMSNYKEYIVVSDALTISVNAKNPISIASCVISTHIVLFRLFLKYCFLSCDINLFIYSQLLP